MTISARISLGFLYFNSNIYCSVLNVYSTVISGKIDSKVKADEFHSIKLLIGKPFQVNT